MNEKFNLELQYLQFLKRMNMSEQFMHEVQKKQLKQTFMGCAGQMLLLLRDDVAELSDDDAMNVMQAMLDQVSNYFKTQIG